MEDKSKHAKGLAVLAIFLILFALGTVVSWVQHFAGDMAEMEAKWGNLDHENALLWADAYMALCALACAFGLLRRRVWGMFFGLLAGFFGAGRNPLWTSTRLVPGHFIRESGSSSYLCDPHCPWACDVHLLVDKEG